MPRKRAPEEARILRKLDMNERLDLWEWLKVQITQERVIKDHLTLGDITQLASVALPKVRIAESSVEPLLRRMGIKTNITEARSKNEKLDGLLTRVADLESKLNWLYNALKENYDTPGRNG